MCTRITKSKRFRNSALKSIFKNKKGVRANARTPPQYKDLKSGQYPLTSFLNEYRTSRDISEAAKPNLQQNTQDGRRKYEFRP